MAYRVKNYEKYQHYKDRRPPWIKLHRIILDDPDFMALSLASRGLLMQVWLLASENNGLIELSEDEIAWRLRVKVNLKPLVDSGLLIECNQVLADDSECLTREEEIREEKKRREKEYCDTFDEFWNLYPKRNGKRLGKDESLDKLKKHVEPKDFDSFLAATKNYSQSQTATTNYAKDPFRWIPKWQDWLEPEVSSGNGQHSTAELESKAKTCYESDKEQNNPNSCSSLYQDKAVCKVCVKNQVKA